MEKDWEICNISAASAVATAKVENRIEGVFSEIAWDLMLSVAEVFAAILAGELGNNSDSFKIIQAFIENKNNVIPCVRVSLPEGDRIPAGEASRLIEVASAFLSSQHHDGQADFFVAPSSALSAGSISHLNAFLEKNGGKRIPTPLRVTAEKTSVAEISGRFAARPTDTIEQNKVLSIRGTVVIVDVDKRTVVCKPDPSGARLQKLTIGFSEDFLVELANSLGHRRRVEVRYTEVLDANGKKFFDLREISPCASPGASSSEFDLQSDP